MTKRTQLIFWTCALALLLFVLIMVNLPKKETPVGTAVGERLPGFSVVCTDGSTFSLEAQRGKVTVINLWATWCTPCVKELPNFDRLQKEHPDTVAVLALHSPPVTTDVSEYLSAYSYEIPFAVDESGSLSALLGAGTVLPQTVIVDPGGVVTYNQPGAMDYDTLEALCTGQQASGERRADEGRSPRSPR